jgi:hypothetical protein
MSVRNRFERLVPGLLVALLLAGTTMAQEIPAKLVAPAGATQLGVFAAKGVQIYACTAHGTANEWTFKAPEAQLVDAEGAVFAKHYAGPTWEAADGSRIVGKVIATAPAPTAGAIPWLLLSAQPSGNGVLAGVRFVQRINTVGGVAPTGACPDPGAEQRVPYTAQYVLYK